jgi:hypothetical protein
MYAIVQGNKAYVRILQKENTRIYVTDKQKDAYMFKKQIQAREMDEKTQTQSEQRLSSNDTTKNTIGMRAI